MVLKRLFKSHSQPSVPESGLLLDYQKLIEQANDSTQCYRSADPFPHIVIDNFVAESVLDKVLQEFPTPEGKIGWLNRQAYTDDGLPASVGKLDFGNVAELPTTLRQLSWEFNSKLFLRFLQRLTGIMHLIPDPHYWGGGIHQTLPGGQLRIHADFQTHPMFRLDRRINVLLYLNRDWKEEYGGHLELWDSKMKNCVHRILPIAGRCVVFNTDADSYHGQPQPLTCPDSMSRKSLALYYYTNGRNCGPEQLETFTNWQKLPTEQADASPA